MKTFLKILLLFAVIASAVAAWLHFRTAAASGTAQFATAAVDRGDILQTVTANGSLEAVQTVDVGSEVSGKIVELFADYNSAVTNGQLLARIDDSSYLRSREQCQAELDAAEASLKLAEANFRRAEELHASSLLSRADYDDAEAALSQARASLRMRKAALDKVLVDISKTLIYSPMDGMVLSRAVDVGQTVAASMTTPVLFTLARDLRQMRIEAEVSEADVGGVAEGQEVSFSVDAFPERTFSGTVSQVRYEPVTSQNVVNYIAIVDVLNEDLKLRPGMTANATITTEKRANVLRIPSAALRFRLKDGETAAPPSLPAPPANASGERPAFPPDGAFPAPPTGSGSATANAPAAFPAPPTGPNGERPALRSVFVQDPDSGAVREVPVPLGISDGSYTEVLAGLSEGDLVVTGRRSADSGKSAAPAANRSSSPFMPGPPRRR